MTRPESIASTTSDDARTIDACRRGDRDALDQLFRAEAPALQRTIARLVGGGPDVEDLLQATLATAIAAFPRFRGEALVRTWLTGIAVRVVHGHLRRPDRTRRVSLELLPENLESAATPRPDRHADSRRALARVYAHVEALHPRQRIAFILHVIDGRSVEEVAALTGASRAATKSRVFWARLRLLKRLRNDPGVRDLIEREDS